MVDQWLYFGLMFSICCQWLWVLICPIACGKIANLTIKLEENPTITYVTYKEIMLILKPNVYLKYMQILLHASGNLNPPHIALKSFQMKNQAVYIFTTETESINQVSCKSWLDSSSDQVHGSSLNNTSSKGWHGIWRSFLPKGTNKIDQFHDILSHECVCSMFTLSWTL